MRNCYTGRANWVKEDLRGPWKVCLAKYAGFSGDENYSNMSGYFA